MKKELDILKRLAALVEATADDEINCEVFLDRVARFLEMQDKPETLDPSLQEVAQHLRACPECLEEYDALLEAQKERD